jgi:hypothetical protein
MLITGRAGDKIFENFTKKTICFVFGFILSSLYFSWLVMMKPLRLSRPLHVLRSSSIFLRSQTASCCYCRTRSFSTSTIISQKSNKPNKPRSELSEKGAVFLDRLLLLIKEREVNQFFERIKNNPHLVRWLAHFIF